MVLLCKTDILVDTTKIFTASTRVANANKGWHFALCLVVSPKAIKVLFRCG